MTSISLNPISYFWYLFIELLAVFSVLLADLPSWVKSLLMMLALLTLAVHFYQAQKNRMQSLHYLALTRQYLLCDRWNRKRIVQLHSPIYQSQYFICLNWRCFFTKKKYLAV
jgi:hypothetical protein